MKRCPQCNRVETDDSLAFCRADGTSLIGDSGSVNADAGTIKFTSAPVSGEDATNVLPNTPTTPEINRSTGPTTVLSQQHTLGTTRELATSNKRKAVLVALIVVVAGIVVA